MCSWPDILNGRDTRMIAFDDADQRRGALALTMDYSLRNGMRLSGHWLPELRADRLSFRAPGVELHEARDRFDPTQYAIKLDRSGGKLDWSLSWFDGLDRTGRLRVTQVTPTAIQITTENKRLRMLGMDAATTWEGYGLRAEMAHLMPHGERDTITNRDRDQTIGVIGMDRTFPDDWYGSLQGFARHTWHHEQYSALTNPLDQAVALMNDLRGDQTCATRYGWTLYLKKPWQNETLQTDLFTMYYIDSQDWLIRPKVQYKINDDWRIALGMERFLGDADTTMGSLRRNSLVFFEVRQGF